MHDDMVGCHGGLTSCGVRDGTVLERSQPTTRMFKHLAALQILKTGSCKFLMTELALSFRGRSAPVQEREEE